MPPSPPKRYVLALDSGTTSSRAIVFDRAGAIRGLAQRELTQHFPRPGWVEHDPEEIWSGQMEVAAEALSRAQIGVEDLAAVGIANQRETTLVWDRATGRPVHPAIVWQDRRTADACDRLIREGHEETFARKTGLCIDPYFSATKLQWILDRVEGARDRALRGDLAFGTVDTWLVWKLTEGRVHVTDASNASRTLLFDIHEGGWDDELLALVDVPRAMLPLVRNSSEVYGLAAAGTPLAAVPIAGIAGDQQAALFGQACFEPGMAKNTYGTGCFLLLCTGDEPVRSRNALLTTVASRIGGRTEYALEGSVFVGGAVVQWLRDGLGIVERSSDVERLAASVPDSGGAYLVPAFTGLGAPHWDPYARGAILGLTRGTTAAHLARAALESIAFQSHDVLRAMERDAGIELCQLRADGGAAANDLLLQFQADVLGARVVRPSVTETTALGAAALAGLAVGFWSDRSEIARQWRAERVFEPMADRTVIDAQLDGWRRAVERAKGWAPHGDATSKG